MKYNVIVTYHDNDFRTVFYALKDLVDNYLIPEQFETKEDLIKRIKELLVMAVDLTGYIGYGIEEETKIYVPNVNDDYQRHNYSSVYFETDLEGVSNIYIS